MNRQDGRTRVLQRRVLCSFIIEPFPGVIPHRILDCVVSGPGMRSFGCGLQYYVVVGTAMGPLLNLFSTACYVFVFGRAPSAIYGFFTRPFPDTLFHSAGPSP
jgi:hypothetical protein